MDAKVIKVLKENVWHVATYGDYPNVVPIGFKDVTEDGKLVVGDIFLETTMKNVQANGKAAVSAFDPATSEGYQVKGAAEYVTTGPVVDKFKALAEKMFKGTATAKGALIITPEHVIVTSPGPENKKEL